MEFTTFEDVVARCWTVGGRIDTTWNPHRSHRHHGHPRHRRMMYAVAPEDHGSGGPSYCHPMSHHPIFRHQSCPEYPWWKWWWPVSIAWWPTVVIVGYISKSSIPDFRPAWSIGSMWWEILRCSWTRYTSLIVMRRKWWSGTVISKG
jgi:hypothetical protein